jgi:ORF6N domain
MQLIGQHSESRNEFMGEKKRAAALVAIDAITSRILVIRGQKVMLDMDLAALYGVTTKRLNEQMRRNLDRFPSDFVFQLTVQEVASLRSQFATSSSGLQQRAWGGRRYAPYAFTEHGAIMAAMVLNSARAMEISVYVVRAFVQQRDVLVANKELAKRLDELESRIELKLSTHDQAISAILDAIRQLMSPPEPARKRRIGFVQTD